MKIMWNLPGNVIYIENIVLVKRKQQQQQQQKKNWEEKEELICHFEPDLKKIEA